MSLGENYFGTIIKRSIIIIVVALAIIALAFKEPKPYLYGMFFGSAMAHNFNLAAGPASAATADQAAALGGPGPYGQAATIICILVLFIIAMTGIKKAKKA